jgi:hypothetical protein
LAHESQYATTMHITSESASSPSDNGADEHHEISQFREAVLERAAEAGKLSGVQAGEAFKHISRL